MESSRTRTVARTTMTIDASTPESPEAINRRLKDAGIMLRGSEVKPPLMDR
jgi:hypothetical protein